jgi:hypothetical protein
MAITNERLGVGKWELCVEGPLASGLGEGLTTAHYKIPACY